MGCAASREAYESADISVAKPQSITPVPRSAVLKEAVTYKMKGRIFRLREDYDIVDTSGNVAAKMLGKYISLRDRQILAGADGKKALVLIRKVLTFKPAFYFYTYTPNFTGQESTETEGGEKLYKFAILQQVLLSLPTRWDYSMFTQSNDAAEKVAAATSVCNLLYIAGTLADLDGAPLLKFTQTSMVSGGEGGLSSGYEVEVAAGMDPLQAIAICIAAPQTFEKNWGHASGGHASGAW